ncbi:hypothetical protein HII13_001774 [Brettanomyces bruxellensis]|nr:hypothetical protein HII13_001774 [Brettanomyces bruxellensis]
MNAQRQVVENEVFHLLRLAARSFYPHQCVLILEALMFHSVLYEEDLLKLTCMHKKVFRSFCNRLLDDRLITSYTQKEETSGPAGQYRWLSRTYYYIHYLEAIDSIKWKVHCLVKFVKDEIGQFNDPQGYVCPTCHAKYSLLDVPSLLSEDKMRFECSVCGDTLVEDDTDLEAQKGQEKLERLMAQLEPIIESLKKIDTMKVDDNNFETALIKAVPPSSNSIAAYTVTNRTGRRKKAGNDGTSAAARRSQATIHVSITADDEDIKRERMQREKRNEKLRQNALPSWHRESAVGGGSLGVLHDEPVPTEQQQDSDNVQVKIEGESGDSTQVKQESGVTKPKVEPGFEHAESPVKQEDENTNKEELSQPSLSVSQENSKILNSSDEEDNTSGNNTAVEIKGEEPPSTGLSMESDVLAKVKDETKEKSDKQPSSGSATTEELNALTAYYAQLRQRQAEEEEEEEDEEEEEEDGDGENDEDDVDEFEAFEEADEEDGKNDENSSDEEKNKNSPEKQHTDDISDEDNEKTGEQMNPDNQSEEKHDATKDSDQDMDDEDIDDAIFEEMEEMSDAE